MYFETRNEGADTRLFAIPGDHERLLVKITDIDQEFEVNEVEMLNSPDVGQGCEAIEDHILETNAEDPTWYKIAIGIGQVIVPTRIYPLGYIRRVQGFRVLRQEN